MNRPRFSIGRLIIVAGVVGVGSGLLARHASLRMIALDVARFAVLLTPVISLVVVFRIEPRMPLRYRLAIEFAILGVLLLLSAILRTPSFDQGDQRRCEELATLATLSALDADPKQGAALDREAAWFARKGSELKWRTVWLGLTRGPFANHLGSLTRREEEFELGVAESMKKHEKRLRRILTPGPPAP